MVAYPILPRKYGEDTGAGACIKFQGEMEGVYAILLKCMPEVKSGNC
jgi:hypothetical protein